MIRGNAKGRPMTTASSTAALIKASERMVSSHNPISPVYAKAAAAMAPERYMRLRAGIRNTMARTTNHGSQSKASADVEIIQPMALLIGVKNPVNTG